MNSKSRVSCASNRIFLFVVLSMSLALLACGGGGGGGNPSLTATSSCDYAGLNQSLNGRLSATDSQGRSPTYRLVSDGSKGHVTITNPLTGEFTYTPNTNARGTDSFTFRAEAGASTSNTATFTIVYTPRIMPTGDSITEGVELGGTPNLPEPNSRISYRKRLYERLAGAGYRIDFVGSLANGSAAGISDPDHEGHPGWCDDNCGGFNFKDNITGILNNNSPDAILLHIGSNDFNTDASGVSSILDQISAWASSNWPMTVFLAKIIPSRDGVDSLGRPMDVSTFNNGLQGVATSINRSNLRIVIVDQQSALRSADANKANPALMGDNLHPKNDGYVVMGDRWAESIFSSGALSKCP